MTGCVFVILTFLVPRAVCVGIYCFEDWFGQAFETNLCPFIGFVLVPRATLAYMGAMLNNDYRLSGEWLFIFIAALLVDLSSASSSEEKKP